MKIFLLISGIILAAAPTAFAQTTENYEVFITWRADNFFPSDYSGKAWAAPFSPIEAAAVLTKNKKIADLSNAEIFWYLDKELIGKGLGRQSESFNISKQSGDKHFLSVSIKTEAGKRHESALEIPVLGPKLAIANNFMSNSVPANSRLQMSVVPYFFNIRSLDDLLMKWRVNNQISEGGQLTINTGMPVLKIDKTFFAEIEAQNRKNAFEKISERLKMEIY